MAQWIRNSPVHKHLLETELERCCRLQDFEVVFAPSCSPRMTPVELLWRDTKNHVRVSLQRRVTVCVSGGGARVPGMRGCVRLQDGAGVNG